MQINICAFWVRRRGCTYHVGVLSICWLTPDARSCLQKVALEMGLSFPPLNPRRKYSETREQSSSQSSTKISVKDEAPSASLSRPCFPCLSSRFRMCLVVISQRTCTDTTCLCMPTLLLRRRRQRQSPSATRGSCLTSSHVGATAANSRCARRKISCAA